MSDIKQKAREWYKEWLEGDYGFDFNEYLADKVQEATDLAIAEERKKILDEVNSITGAFPFKEQIKDSLTNNK